MKVMSTEDCVSIVKNFESGIDSDDIKCDVEGIMYCIKHHMELNNVPAFSDYVSNRIQDDMFDVVESMYNEKMDDDKEELIEEIEEYDD